MIYDYSQKYKKSEKWCGFKFRPQAYFVWLHRSLVTLGKCFDQVSVECG